MKPFQVKDFLVSKELFSLRYDRGLNAWQTTPELSSETLQEYYPKQDYLSHTNNAKNTKERLYLWVKKQNIKTKLRWVSVLHNKGKLLDYGAGNGAFVQAAQAKGWKTYAFDFSETAKRQLTKKGINQINEVRQNDNYDVITLWHVFEHLPNPQQQLKRFYEALLPGGILALAIPNHSSWDAKHYGLHWAAYDVPRHLWHYNKSSISALGCRAGFRVLKIRNMFWDAFYISLLSEQYKNSQVAWPKAIVKGLYSNLVGWRKRNTSAITIILQKPK